MPKLFALLTVFTCLSGAANAPIREVTSQAAEGSGMPVAAFFKGYIYWAGRENPLTIYTPDGYPAAYFLAPEKTAQAIAADTDGGLAIAWRTETSGGIDLFGASRELVRTIETGRYRPQHLSFAEDHSLWTLGYQTRAGHAEMWDDSAYMIVRKFLPNGQQAGAYLPRSLFPHGLPPGDEAWQWSNCITVAHNRVGLWVVSGMYSGETEWVELDLDGNLTGRWRLDPFSYELRVAFTSDGHVFVQHADLDPQNHTLTYSLLTLDRASSTWQPAQSAPGGRLVSADGDALIFAERSSGPIHLRWYPHP
ncbi:MAG: hypothetical protein ABSG03_32825 [Bryobacteraceae bacterium]